jgi:Ca-activated chloride channel family protein
MFLSSDRALPLRAAAFLVLAAGALFASGCAASPTTLGGHYVPLVPGHGATMKSAPKSPGEAETSNTEAYDRIYENDFLSPAREPLSTFAIDVDTASYSNTRRFLLTEKRLPPRDAVRIEELVNYFPYQYGTPDDGKPFATHVEVGQCPWHKEHRLVRIGLKGREIDKAKRPPSNLVFLIDISGSMSAPNRLPLVKRGLRLLVDELTENDRVAVVVYASGTGVALPSTPASDKQQILGTLDRLQAAGSTNGGAGIQLAYDQATAHFIKGGTNRVILCTDGDFNVGITNQGDLTRLIEDRAKSGVFLTVLGFGMGNLKDSTLEKLADKGHGNYAYIDTLNEARKVLVEQMGGTLVCIAKDVKVQVEFNPAKVTAYRLIGYENRLMKAQDFNDDKKDAGDIGAGHTVTALYEVVPAGQKIDVPDVDPLKYQQPAASANAARGPDLLTLKLRFKEPEGEKSELLEFPVVDGGVKLDATTEDFRFAAAVAEFGLLLRGSRHKADANFNQVRDLASGARTFDPSGYRAEFLELVKAAEGLAGK